MPFCHGYQTFRGGPDLQGVVFFIVIVAMVALGIVAQSLFVMAIVSIF